MILSADKGRSTVFMKKSDETKLLLDDTTAYKVVVGNPLSGVVNRLNAFILRLKAENKITHKEQQLMILRIAQDTQDGCSTPPHSGFQQYTHLRPG